MILLKTEHLHLVVFASRAEHGRSQQEDVLGAPILVDGSLLRRVDLLEKVGIAILLVNWRGSNLLLGQ